MAVASKTPLSPGESRALGSFSKLRPSFEIADPIIDRPPRRSRVKYRRTPPSGSDTAAGCLGRPASFARPLIVIGVTAAHVLP